MNEELKARLRDVGEQNALIVRRQAADRIELYEMTIVSLCERDVELKETLRLLLQRDPHEPWETDISDFSDEWCAGFFAGQENARDVIERAVPNPASEPKEDAR